MSEPPALPEPIKPPRGDFSLEERKWREGITRAINILTEEIGHIVTTGDLDGDSYISVAGGTDAVLGSGTSLSFNDTNIAKLNRANTYSNYNTFSNGLATSSIDLNGSDLATLISDLGTAIAGKADSFTKGNIGGDSYISVNGGTNAVIGSGVTLSFTDTNLAKLNANNVFTGATNTFKALSLAGNITIDQDNIYKIGNTGSRFNQVWARQFWLGDHCHIYTNDHYRIAFEWYNSSASASRTLLLIDNSIYAYNLNKQINLGTQNNLWRAVYSNVFYVGGGDVVIANTTTTDSTTMQLQWKNGTSARAVYFTGNDVKPSTGNTLNLGTSNERWKTIYTNNTVNVSDRRMKSEVEPLEDALKKLNSLKIKSYRLNGDDECISFGFIAQDEIEKNPELIYVPRDYSEKKDGGELGFMPNNVLFLTVRAVQELSDKIKKLKESYGNNTKDR